MPHSAWSEDGKADHGAGGKRAREASTAHTTAGRTQLQEAAQEWVRGRGDRPGHTPCCSPTPETFLGNPLLQWQACLLPGDKNQAKGRVRAQHLEAERNSKAGCRAWQRLPQGQPLAPASLASEGACPPPPVPRGGSTLAAESDEKQEQKEDLQETFHNDRIYKQKLSTSFVH